MTISKILLAVVGIFLSILIIMGITTVSVIGIKTLYQWLNPPSEIQSTQNVEFRVGDTIDDVIGFTNQVEQYAQNIDR